MSSFRPATERALPRFVPLPLPGRRASSGTDAAEVVFEARASGGAGRASVGAVGPDATGTGADVAATSIEAEVAAAREAEAYERGRSEARLDADRLEAACSTLEAAAAELAARADREAIAWQELVLGLASAIARRWVGRELSTQPEAFLAMLDRAVERLPERGVAGVRLAPEDLARLDAERPDWRETLAAGRVLEIEADPQLATTEYRVEGAEGFVDGRTSVLLADLEAALSESLDPSGSREGGA